MMMITFLMLTTPVIFIFLEHPLSLGLVLMFKTIFLSLITGMMSYNFWFSYILFMVMVGGMLILFIYMTSVASNEKFKFSYKLMIMISAFMLISLLIMTFDQMFLEMSTLNFELTKCIKENSYLSMSKYMNLPLNKLMYLSISYLLITLIMVVKVTEINNGPLRQMF